LARHSALRDAAHRASGVTPPNTAKKNPVGQLSLPPGRVEILVRKSITPCGLLLARRQTELAKWVILKEKCFNDCMKKPRILRGSKHGQMI
jgi:hypothetical protein